MEARSLRVHMLFILLGAHVLPMVSLINNNHIHKHLIDCYNPSNFLKLLTILIILKIGLMYIYVNVLQSVG